MLDYHGLMELASQRAKEEAKLFYKDGDERIKKKEKELKNRYFLQYTTFPRRCYEVKLVITVS